jgi:hypothetical protein
VLLAHERVERVVLSSGIGKYAMTSSPRAAG